MDYLLYHYFRTYSLTGEDLQKTEQYRANAERIQAQAAFVDFEEYLKSLDMELTISAAHDITAPRIAQMTQKTNQFNLTTKRYTDADIRHFMNAGDIIYSLSVKDKFGDNGITGAVIFKKIAPQVYEIDTFLLSCRILGKGIERAFLHAALNKMKATGARHIHARYIPSAKNMQTKDFFEKNGFQTTAQDEKGCKTYSVDIPLRDFAIKPYFKIIL
jgi:FkbH-like protein